MLTFLDVEPDSVTQEEYATKINRSLESEDVDVRIDSTQVTKDVINRYKDVINCYVETIDRLNPDESMAHDKAAQEYKSSLLSLLG